jgi:hypothetical protein
MELLIYNDNLININYILLTNSLLHAVMENPSECLIY